MLKLTYRLKRAAEDINLESPFSVWNQGTHV